MFEDDVDDYLNYNRDDYDFDDDWEYDDSGFYLEHELESNDEYNEEW